MKYEIIQTQEGLARVYATVNDSVVLAEFYGSNAKGNATKLVAALEGKPWTRDEFREIVGKFLETQDDVDLDEYYISPKKMAIEVLDNFEKFLFAEEVAREERLRKFLELEQEYLKMKREFEGGQA